MMTFRELFNEWLWDEYQLNVRKKAVYLVSSVYEKHIDVVFGNLEISTISRKMLVTYLTLLDMNKNPYTNVDYSASTIKKIKFIFSKCFKYAYIKRYIDQLPYENIKSKTRIKGNTAQALSLSDQYKLEKYILKHYTKEPYFFGIVLVLYTGLRISELCSLTWDDIILKESTIQVNKALAKDYDFVNQKFTVVEDRTKTATSNRKIIIPDYIIPYLTKLKKKRKSNYFIEDKMGKRIDLKQYRDLFNKIVEEIKITHINFHGLRHTYATRAIESGMDVKTLSELMGHSSPSITQSTYIHVSKKRVMEEMERCNIPIFEI